MCCFVDSLTYTAKNVPIFHFVSKKMQINFFKKLLNFFIYKKSAGWSLLSRPLAVGWSLLSYTTCAIQPLLST